MNPKSTEKMVRPIEHYKKQEKKQEKKQNIEIKNETIEVSLEGFLKNIYKQTILPSSGLKFTYREITTTEIARTKDLRENIMSIMNILDEISKSQLIKNNNNDEILESVFSLLDKYSVFYPLIVTYVKSPQLEITKTDGMDEKNLSNMLEKNILAIDFLDTTDILYISMKILAAILPL